MVRTKLSSRLTSRILVFWLLTDAAALCAYVLFSLPAIKAAQTQLARNALWEVIHNVCVPGQSQYGNPAPCLRVDLAGGGKNGFAILQDPRKSNQFLVIPTERIAGIESPALREPGAPNYFASAWQSRTFINDAIHRELPRDDVGMAVNSVEGRTQDQLHIHLTCARVDVVTALHKNEASIGTRWSPFPVSFFGHRYTAMWVPGENLDQNNPFILLAEMPDAASDMSNRTLAIVGLTRADGTKGFVLLSDHVNKKIADEAGGEELLDHTCALASSGSPRTDSRAKD